MQCAQGADIEDAILVSVVDDTDDDRVMKRETLFDQVVEYPVRLVCRQHILRIRIDVNTRQLRRRQDCHQDSQHVNRAWFVDRK